MPEITNPFNLDLNVPHLDQYFGVWAIQDGYFRNAVERVQGIDLRMHVEARRAVPADSEGLYAYQVIGSTAVIEVNGTLMKYVSSLSGGTSTVALRRQLRNAVSDDVVSAIALRIDSPGGTVSGTRDFADEVAAAAQKKPVHAYIEDMGASAAYWIASQASKVYANPTGIIGSIGTFAVIEDFSAQAAQKGIKVHVVRAGDMKGAGVDGTEVTPAQLAEWQRVVNELNEHFVRAVASGRGLSLAAVRSLADGRVHIGAAAESLGLIDGVQSFDSTIEQLSRTLVRRPKAMSQTETGAAVSTEPKPATYAELKAACIGADSDFICKQMDAAATLDTARSNWMAEQNNRLQAAKTETEKAKAAAEKPGVEALGGYGRKASAEITDPIAEFSEAVDAKAKSGMTRPKAIAAVVKSNPDLHTAYVAACNAGRRKTA
jgi:signal peptide peptidase SppA